MATRSKSDDEKKDPNAPHRLNVDITVGTFRAYKRAAKRARVSTVSGWVRTLLDRAAGLT